MPKVYREGVCCIGFKDTGKSEVVLIKRNDFRVWWLPGGNREEGENLDVAARREYLEESGCEGIRDLVYHGMYELQLGNWRDVQHMFSGISIGKPHKTDEAMKSKFFRVGSYPFGFPPFYADRIRDAKNGVVYTETKIQKIGASALWRLLLLNPQVVLKAPGLIKKLLTPSK